MPSGARPQKFQHYQFLADVQAHQATKFNENIALEFMKLHSNDDVQSAETEVNPTSLPYYADTAAVDKLVKNESIESLWHRFALLAKQGKDHRAFLQVIMGCRDFNEFIEDKFEALDDYVNFDHMCRSILYQSLNFYYAAMRGPMEQQDRNNIRQHLGASICLLHLYQSEDEDTRVQRFNKLIVEGKNN